MKKTYDIEVDCANCANEMQEELKKVDGIKDVSVNFIMKKMDVEFEDGADVDTVIKNARNYIREQDDEIEIFI